VSSAIKQADSNLNMKESLKKMEERHWTIFLEPWDQEGFLK
jgi:hypothetical protein